jgi:acyl-coenzyme A synthetase/AMP-(fatty) acid ligase
LLAKTVQDQLEQAQYQLELHVRQSHKLFLDAPKNISSRVYLDTHYMEHGDRDVLILHSSGTTGLPKAIRQSHGYILNYLMCYDFSDAECYRLNLTSLPLYHVSLSTPSLRRLLTSACPGIRAAGATDLDEHR